MGLLDNFERGLERVVNGAFAKTFRSGLQPVEVSAALKRELETKAAVVSRERILAPNQFIVHLSPGDYERLNGIGPALISDFVRIVNVHAQEQGFQFAGVVTVTLQQDDKLTDGLLQIDSSNVQTQVTWIPVLDIAGKRYPLRSGAMVIGRGHEADITVDDAGISRKHLQIAWDGSNAQATDLGSTNGSQLNGQPLTTAILQPESLIQIGNTSVIYRIVPHTEGAAPAAPSRAPIPAEPLRAPEPPAPAPAPVPAATGSESDPELMEELFGSAFVEPDPADAAPAPPPPAAAPAPPVPAPAPRAQPKPRPAAKPAPEPPSKADPDAPVRSTESTSAKSTAFWRDL